MHVTCWPISVALMRKCLGWHGAGPADHNTVVELALSRLRQLSIRIRGACFKTHQSARLIQPSQCAWPSICLGQEVETHYFDPNFELHMDHINDCGGLGRSPSQLRISCLGTRGYNYQSCFVQTRLLHHIIDSCLKGKKVCVCEVIETPSLSCIPCLCSPINPAT